MNLRGVLFSVVEVVVHPVRAQGVKGVHYINMVAYGSRRSFGILTEPDQRTLSVSFFVVEANIVTYVRN